MYKSQIRDEKTKLDQLQNTFDSISKEITRLQTKAIERHNQKQLEKEQKETIIEEIDIEVLEENEKKFTYTTAIMKKSLKNARQYLRESTDLFDRIVSTWPLVFGKERNDLLKEFTEKYAQRFQTGTV